MSASARPQGRGRFSPIFNVTVSSSPRAEEGCHASQHVRRGASLTLLSMRAREDAWCDDGAASMGIQARMAAGAAALGRRRCPSACSRRPQRVALAFGGQRVSRDDAGGALASQRRRRWRSGPGARWSEAQTAAAPLLVLRVGRGTPCDGAAARRTRGSCPRRAPRGLLLAGEGPRGPSFLNLPSRGVPLLLLAVASCSRGSRSDADREQHPGC